jgi:hypothetical protein
LNLGRGDFPCDSIGKTMTNVMAADPFGTQVSGITTDSLSIAVLPTE